MAAFLVLIGKYFKHRHYYAKRNPVRHRKDY